MSATVTSRNINDPITPQQINKSNNLKVKSAM